MLDECSRYCDYLIVLINDDEYVERKKGCVPLSETERSAIVIRHQAVREVHSFPGPNEDNWLRQFRAEVMPKHFPNASLTVFHSDEFSGRPWLPGQCVADEIIFIPKIESHYKCSVSQIFETIRGR
jgi:hypothetical protein